ncbi:hypothetical protein DFH11DRAFT_1260378 [Phellopilus nigrolimitatus]|nr:hypothetical protein DFH11DRAFT_1260378 [Phellopilus nigrolimitatus]
MNGKKRRQEGDGIDRPSSDRLRYHIHREKCKGHHANERSALGENRSLEDEHARCDRTEHARCQRTRGDREIQCRARAARGLLALRGRARTRRRRARGLPKRGCTVVLRPYELRRRLREGIHAQLQVRGELDGEHARVRDAHVGRAVHEQIRVHDAALLLGQHRTRACGVVLCGDGICKPRVPLVVGVDGRTRPCLRGEILRERCSLSDLTREFESLAEGDDVERM